MRLSNFFQNISPANILVFKKKQRISDNLKLEFANNTGLHLKKLFPNIFQNICPGYISLGFNIIAVEVHNSKKNGTLAKLVKNETPESNDISSNKKTPSQRGGNRNV